MYDITDRATFKNIEERWIPDIENHVLKNTQYLLVGAKSDLQEERAIPFDEGEALAEKLGCKFLETSAKTATNVKQAFEVMAKVIKKNEIDFYEKYDKEK